MLGKIEGGRRRRRRDEMVGWYHRLNGHEFEQTLGDGERQGSLECCSPWGCRVGHDLVIEQQQWFWTPTFLIVPLTKNLKEHESVCSFKTTERFLAQKHLALNAEVMSEWPRRTLDWTSSLPPQYRWHKDRQLVDIVSQEMRGEMLKHHQTQIRPIGLKFCDAELAGQ